MKISAETHHIDFWRVFTLMALGPIVAFVYAMYSFGYWMTNSGWPRAVIYPYALLFGAVNIAHNVTVCTILFRELPREFFTTQRLRRWKLSDDLARRELADMLGGFLNRHDEGHY